MNPDELLSNNALSILCGLFEPRLARLSRARISWREWFAVDRYAIELRFRSSSAASARSSSGRARMQYSYAFQCTFMYIYIYIYIYVYIYIYITWNNRLHVADGPSFPGRIVGRPCLLAGYPSARDFRLASLILDNANLVVISDKPEKNPGEGHFAGYFPEFIRRLPTVTLEDTSHSVVAREDGLTEDRFKADDAHDIRNVISFRKKDLFRR